MQKNVPVRAFRTILPQVNHRPSRLFAPPAQPFARRICRCIVLGLVGALAFGAPLAQAAAPVINCPANITLSAVGGAGAAVSFTVIATDDSGVPPTIVCVPPSDSLFPLGPTTVTCTATDADAEANTCSFTVTVRGARGIKENVLAELVALRTSVTNRNDDRKLDAIIKELNDSLATRFWVDETHLKRNFGRKVFHKEMLTAQKLCHLIKSATSHIPDEILQGFVDEILQAARLLAVVRIEDAIATGASNRKIEHAQQFVAKGDAAAADDKCSNAIKNYRTAWKHAVH
jgi:hypothetical protein